MIKNNHIYIINSLEDFEDFQKKSKYKWSFGVKYVSIKEEILKNNSILAKDSLFLLPRCYLQYYKYSNSVYKK